MIAPLHPTKPKPIYKDIKEKYAGQKKCMAADF